VGGKIRTSAQSSVNLTFQTGEGRGITTKRKRRKRALKKSFGKRQRVSGTSVKKKIKGGSKKMGLSLSAFLKETGRRAVHKEARLDSQARAASFPV